MVPTDCAVLLTELKYDFNLAAAMRAGANLGCPRVFWSGTRVLDVPKHPRPKRGRGRAAAESHLDDFGDVRAERVRDAAELILRLKREGYAPIAVELTAQATSLERFKHPERALYVLGPEDGSLDPALMKLCHQTVMLPTAGCANVAQAMFGVLLHRRMEALKGGRLRLAG